MTPAVDLDGRRALVTGGASGIGAGAARRLAERGADVVVGDIDELGGRALAAELGATFAVHDVADPRAWDALVAEHGPFDIGFLNAGISTNDGRAEGELPVVGTTDETYRRIMGINVDGVVFGTRALLPHLLERGSGDIIVTASMAGLAPIPMDPIYGLTKHAVVGFVRSMAAAIDQHAGNPDICISSVCPGFTDTNIISDDAKSHLHGLGVALLSPTDVADVVERALAERVQAAQWVIWPGAPVAPYPWAPALPGMTA